ncbi:MAG: PAS domain-containing protein [Bacteroidota bacterium]
MRKIRLTINNTLSIFVSIITILAVTNFVIIKYYKTKQDKDSALVDAAGRNRMLSQKIGLYAEMLVSGKEAARPALESAINLHDVSLRSLKNGGVVPSIANEMMLPGASRNIMPVLEDAEKLWISYKNNAFMILSEPNYDGAPQPNPEVQAALSFIEENAPLILIKNNQLVKSYVASSVKKQSTLDFILIALLIFNILTVAGGFLFARKFIIYPIRSLARASGKVAKGNSHESINAHTDPDIMQIAKSITKMGKNIEQSAEFSASIGNGQFDFEFDEEAKNNRLFNELSNMRLKLMKVAEEDKRHSWVTEGLASFGEILRSNQDDIKILSDNIISKMVKYLNANQGSIFVLSEEKEEDQYMDLQACYAWDRKKYIEKKIAKGQGLIGQSWMEADIIYMTKIPDNYITITSGLGGATPSALLIVPLAVNDEIFGVMEIASFNELEDFQIDFVKTVGENIASTLSSAKINQRTKVLLDQSQQQAEEMRAQEEEIRQNMEEMQATQEEMSRKQLDLNGKMMAIDSSNALIEFEPGGQIITANDLFLKCMGYNLEEIQGKHHSIFIDSKELVSEEYKSFWDKLDSGQSFTGEFKRKAKDKSDVWLSASYTPIIDRSGSVIKIIKLAQNTTEEKLRNTNFENQINAINLSQGVIEFDLRGHIQSANEVFLDLMGYSLQEIKGKHHSIFCEQDYASSANYTTFWKNLAKGEFDQGEFKRIKKDGEKVLLKATYTPILDMVGKPYKVIKFASEMNVLVEN